MTQPDLETTRTDVAAAVARGVASAVPFIGGLIAEAVNHIIPNQKIDRCVEWLRILDAKVAALDPDLAYVKHRMGSAEGLDLFEDGLNQAARTPFSERREHLANLLATSLTQERLKYAESKKLLNVLRELTDAELIMLIYHSKPIHLSSQWHAEFMEKHREVLYPARHVMGSSQEEIDRGALQESYRGTLIRFGLLCEKSNRLELSSFGRLMLRYIQGQDDAAA